MTVYPGWLPAGGGVCASCARESVCRAMRWEAERDQAKGTKAGTPYCSYSFVQRDSKTEAIRITRLSAP